jgi:hypothetical protein
MILEIKRMNIASVFHVEEVYELTTEYAHIAVQDSEF